MGIYVIKSNLDIIKEKQIHDDFRKKYPNCGEWYNNIDLEKIKKIIIEDYGGIIDYPTNDDLLNAIEWKKYLSSNLIQK